METKKGGSKGLIFVWIYLVCIGIMWLGNLSYIGLERVVAINIYNHGMDTLADADAAIVAHKFDNDEVKAQYYAQDAEFKRYLIHLKKWEIDRSPFKGLLIGVVALFTAMTYVLAGVKIFRRSQSALKLLKLGIGGFFLHYVLLIAVTLSNLLHINKRIAYISLIFEPQARYSLFDVWIVPMTALGVFFMAIGYTFYVLLPRVFLSRPNIKAQLK